MHTAPYRCNETVRQDDRTEAERASHRWLVIGTDSFMSGWGGAKGGTSVAAWACTAEDLDKVEAWVRNRKDMRRVRIHSRAVHGTYRPRSGFVHLHIYVARPGHPSLSGGWLKV